VRGLPRLRAGQQLEERGLDHRPDLQPRRHALSRQVRLGVLAERRLCLGRQRLKPRVKLVGTRLGSGAVLWLALRHTPRVVCGLIVLVQEIWFVFTLDTPAAFCVNIPMFIG